MKASTKAKAKKFVAKELKKDVKDVKDQSAILKAVGKSGKAKKLVSKELKMDKKDVKEGQTLMGALSGVKSAQKGKKCCKSGSMSKKK